MLYIIGLGLNEMGISLEGVNALKECKKIYLESYTVEFPYKLNLLEKIISRKIIKIVRDEVESDSLMLESKIDDIALLVYGSPLFATTHISLIDECKKNKTKVKVIYAGSVFDAIAESGLQLYKFGKISSMPTWDDDYRPVSFMDFVIENRKINAHSLILVDISLSFKNALNQLIESSKKKIDLGEILVCSKLGIDSKFFYGSVSKLMGEKVKTPFCFVIPGKMHFLEEGVLRRI